MDLVTKTNSKAHLTRKAQLAASEISMSALTTLLMAGHAQALAHTHHMTAAAFTVLPNCAHMPSPKLHCTCCMCCNKSCALTMLQALRCSFSKCNFSQLQLHGA